MLGPFWDTLIIGFIALVIIEFVARRYGKSYANRILRQIQKEREENDAKAKEK